MPRTGGGVAFKPFGFIVAQPPRAQRRTQVIRERSVELERHACDGVFEREPDRMQRLPSEDYFLIIWPLGPRPWSLAPLP